MINSKNDKFFVVFDNLSEIKLGLSSPEPSQCKNVIGKPLIKPFLTRATFNNFQMHLESLQDPHDFHTVGKMNVLFLMHDFICTQEATHSSHGAIS